MRIHLASARRSLGSSTILRVRYASTAVAVQPAPAPAVQQPTAPRPPRIVNQLQGLYQILEGDVGGEQVWSERVQRAMGDVQSHRRLRMGGTSSFPSLPFKRNECRACVAVYSDAPPSVPSAAASVVTSLLLDPFAEDEPTTRAIQARHAEHEHARQEEFVVTYGEGLKRDVGVLSVGAPWIRDAEVDIVEPRGNVRSLSGLIGS